VKHKYITAIQAKQIIRFRNNPSCDGWIK
jgi:hypothetical protein